MMSPKDHLGENVLVRDKTVSRSSYLWEGAPRFISDNNYASFQSISFRACIFSVFNYSVIKHIDSIICINGGFIIFYYL